MTTSLAAMIVEMTDVEEENANVVTTNNRID
jgi:hypothetical protein